MILPSVKPLTSIEAGKLFYYGETKDYLLFNSFPYYNLSKVYIMNKETYDFRIIAESVIAARIDTYHGNALFYVQIREGIPHMIWHDLLTDKSIVLGKETKLPYDINNCYMITNENIVVHHQSISTNSLLHFDYNFEYKGSEDFEKLSTVSPSYYMGGEFVYRDKTKAYYKGYTVELGTTYFLGEVFERGNYIIIKATPKNMFSVFKYRIFFINKLTQEITIRDVISTDWIFKVEERISESNYIAANVKKTKNDLEVVLFKIDDLIKGNYIYEKFEPKFAKACYKNDVYGYEMKDPLKSNLLTIYENQKPYVKISLDPLVAKQHMHTQIQTFSTPIGLLLYYHGENYGTFYIIDK